MVAGWVESLREQMSRFIDLDGGAGLLVNNLDWTRELDVIAFLRDVGKHFSINEMIRKESVRSRIDREGAGISFTEFSYMLLQSYDYVALAERYDCALQLGVRSVGEYHRRHGLDPAHAGALCARADPAPSHPLRWWEVRQDGKRHDLARR